MKLTTKLWNGLGTKIALAGAVAIVGAAALPSAFAEEGGEGGEGGEAGETESMFPGSIDSAIKSILAGEGGEGGAGLSPMWPSVVAPALTGSDIEKVVRGNTLRTNGHVAWYFSPDKKIEGGFVQWARAKNTDCPAVEVETDAFYRGDGICYTFKEYPSQGTWSVHENQLCVNVTWQTGAKNECRYVTILLDDIALFDAAGKIDGKGMKLLKGKSVADLE